MGLSAPTGYSMCGLSRTSFVRLKENRKPKEATNLSPCTGEYKSRSELRMPEWILYSGPVPTYVRHDPASSDKRNWFRKRPQISTPCPRTPLPRTLAVLVWGSRGLLSRGTLFQLNRAVVPGAGLSRATAANVNLGPENGCPPRV